MAETRYISVKVSGELHGQVRAEQESMGITMNEYMEKVLTEHFQFITRGEERGMGPTRTLAFQVSEDLFQRLKNYQHKTNIKQKDFVIGLIEDELERFEMSEKEQSQKSSAEEGERKEQQDMDGPYATAEPQEDPPAGSQRDEEGPDENAAENQRDGEEWTDEKKTGADEPCDDECIGEDEDMGMVPVM